MGKDLLRKNLSQNHKDQTKPTNIFSRSELPTSNPEIKKIEKQRRAPKTTTIRCSIDTADTLNALAALFNMVNVDDLLNKLSFDRISNLTTTEQTEFKTLKTVYTNKRKARK